MDDIRFDLQLFAEDTITVKAVKDFVEKNKDTEDVKTYLKELKSITSKEVETFLETEEGKKLLQPKLDSFFTKGLETWKENNLDKEFETKLADEIAIRYPEETEEQKRIKALEKSNEQTALDLQKERLTNKAISFLNEAKLPLDITEYLIGTDETKTLEILDKFKTMMDTFKKTLTEEFFKEHGRVPAAGTEEPTPLETLEKQYVEAQEKGDALLAMKLHDEIFEKKKKAKIGG